MNKLEVPFLDAKFDGSRLAFRLRIDYAGRGQKEDLAMEMRLTGSDQAELYDVSREIIWIKLTRDK